MREVFKNCKNVFNQDSYLVIEKLLVHVWFLSLTQEPDESEESAEDAFPTKVLTFHGSIADQNAHGALPLLQSISWIIFYYL